MRDQNIVAALRLMRRFIKVDPKKIVILPPSSGGSLGDQAMLDSTAASISRFGDVVLVAVPEPNTTLRTKLTYAPLNGGSKLDKLRAVKEILSAGTILFLGADVIDGAYGGDCRRLGVFDLFVRAGLRGACLGFSVSAKPGARAVERLLNLPPVPMHVRDRLSLERFDKLTGRKGILVADTAFQLRPEVTTPVMGQAIDWARAQRAEGRKVLVVNLGGWTLERMKGDGVAAVNTCLERWLGASPDRAVLLLPHDFKPAPVGDIEPLRRLNGMLAPQFPDRVHFVEPPFNTWDVKALAGEIDFSMTGRMHFSIACLGMGTPTIGIVYQGKFEGLMDHFGLDNMLITPDEASDPDVLLARLNETEAQLPELRERIAGKLPTVKELSWKNFAWLEQGRT
ncbi:polysaccharide pyruvyl transferase family protein [Paenirhodobacter populi]|nr:polysaccharide pyruvyl transferase family protein [Sinirhodobacter populi]